MSPLDAVAAAIRERLLAGHPAPLLGLGTLVRQHVAARVQEKSDGTRVMMPPGETIALGPSSSDESPLAPSFARFRAISPDDAARAYQDAIDQIEALLSATGEVRLPGVGLLRRTSSGVVLGVEAELLAAVNRRYEGLAPVPTTPVHAAVPTPSAPAAPVEEGDEAERLNRQDTDVPDIEAAPRDGRPGLPPIETVPPSEADSAPTHPTAHDADRPEPSASPLIDAPQFEADEEASAVDAGDDAPPAAPLPDLPEEASDAAETLPESVQGEAEAEGDDAAETADPVEVSPYVTPPPGLPEAPSDSAAGLPSVDETLDTFGGAELPDPVVEEDSRSDRATEEVETALDASGMSETETEAETPPLMAPFGAPDAPPLSDVLPPTNPEPAEETPAPGLTPDDEWERETWTAPALGDAPSFDPELRSDTDLVDAVIEDADFDIVPPPSATPAAFAEAPDQGPDAEREAPPVLSVPEPGMGTDSQTTADEAATALALDTPPDVTQPAVAPSSAAAASNRRWTLWVVLVFVLVALAVAALLFWPEIRSRARLLTGPDETITVDATTADGRTSSEAPPGALDGVAIADGARLQNATPGGLPADGASPDADTFGDPTGTMPMPGADRPEGGPAARSPLATRSLATAADDDPPVPTTGLGESPAPGVALLPPRVSGLDARLVAALAARSEPVDPAADAWTFVVLSTGSRAEAETLRDRYRRAGYRSSVLTSRGGQFRVCVGQFASRDDAVGLRDRLPPQAPADTWALYLQTL